MAIKVNDHVIPDWAIEGQAQSLFQSLAEKMAGKPREVIQMAAIDLAKDRLIDQTLMSRESQKRDYKVDAVEVSKQMKQWIRQNGGKKAFEKGNHPVIKDKESLRKEITNQIRFNMLLEEESKCEPVSEEEARKYYDSRPELFKTEETVTASHLLKKASTEEEFAQAKKVILEIRDKIEKGDEFVDWVRKESDDSGNDGNLGEFGRGRMVPEFEKAAFSMNSGELSEPVRTQFGWHLILVKDRKTGTLTSFDEVKQKVKDYLTERRKDTKFDAFLDQLKKEASIEEVSGI
ncbi:MAG: peptidyl-prolyl cis-trans isomerase [Verrucomicrobiota bacterium]|nr:peptidyl-prolyl cis-trans isomerase [Verrucomicrobiota bacterium]